MAQYSSRGKLSARPHYGNRGFTYFANDDPTSGAFGTGWVDTGTGWVRLSGMGSWQDAVDAALAPIDVSETRVIEIISANGGGGDGTHWYAGSGAPDNAVGANGDFYLRTDTADVYHKASGSW
jgi:hypothetical protein